MSRLPKWTSASELCAVSVQVPKYLKCPSATVPSECPPSVPVPSKSPSVRVLSKFLEYSSVLWVFLNEPCVHRGLVRCDWNKILRTKKCTCKRTKMWEETLTILLWRRIRALIWKAFEIGYINLISVKIEFSFSYGHQFKELWVGINDLHITIEQKTFLWNAF